MEYINQDIALLDLGVGGPVLNEELTIINCRIERLSLSAVNFQKRVTIDSCIIGELNLCATWLIGGLTFSRNIVHSEVWWEDGGHNESEIEVSYNIFNGFVGSIDCQFGSMVTVHDNIFKLGCDWFLKDGVGDNYFDGGYCFHDNIGRTDVYFWYYPLKTRLIELLNESIATFDKSNTLEISILKDSVGVLCLKIGKELYRLDMLQNIFPPIDDCKIYYSVVSILQQYFQSIEAKNLSLPGNTAVKVRCGDLNTLVSNALINIS